MSSRWPRIVALTVLMVAILVNELYRTLKTDLSDLAGARFPKSADALGTIAIFIAGCAGYFIAAQVMRRRGIADGPPLGVTAFLIFLGVFIFINGAPDWSHTIPAGVYFVAQMLLWNVLGISVLAAVRNEYSFSAVTARFSAASVAALQSVVGVLGATYAGDPMMATLAAVIGAGSVFAMIALALRSRWFESGEPAAS